MKKLRPADLVLRCYGHRKKNGRWYGVCIDLNLAVEAYDRNELQEKLKNVIVSYLETVYNTNDEQSIPPLLFRRAPLYYWVIYYFTKLIIYINKFPDNFIFNELLPFHLSAKNC